MSKIRLAIMLIYFSLLILGVFGALYIADWFKWFAVAGTVFVGIALIWDGFFSKKQCANKNVE